LPGAAAAANLEQPWPARTRWMGSICGAGRWALKNRYCIKKTLIYEIVYICIGTYNPYQHVYKQGKYLMLWLS